MDLQLFGLVGPCLKSHGYMILVSLEAPKEESGPCLDLFTTMKMMTCATLGAHMIAWK
jgi:hypothetical protein